MKKVLLAIACFMLLAITNATAQESKTQALNAFTKLTLEGNIELHLIKSGKPAIKIETEDAEDIADFTIEVRHNELFLTYEENRSETPKFIVYLEHTGVEEVSMSGLISLFSKDILSGSDLSLEGSGIVKGEIEVAVENLRIDSDGITNLSISGTADNAILNINGLGKINAKKLNAKSVQQHTDGFAKVKIGS
ncbi:DUF2807 domain-containing protein [Maribacter sp.]|nr:DUF2807 domain-containing protein [Maribacter sp.]